MTSRFSSEQMDVPATSRSRTDLRDIVTILRARWMAVAVPVALALALALAYLAVAPRIYAGVTSILIDTRVRPAVGDPTSQLNYSPDAVLVESQVRLISSEPVLRRVVKDENLADDPEFAPTRPGLRTRLFAAIGLSKLPTAEDLTTRAVLNLASRVAVNRSERTYIADIAVTSVDPSKAARLANAVARAYLADQQGARNESAERDSDWVRDQISTMQAALQQAESKAEAYRREHGIIGANGKLLNEQDLGDAATALAAARARTTEIKARYDQVQRVSSSGRNLDTLPDALKSATIEKLKSQFADISRQQASLRQTLGDRHPALLESEQQLRDVRRLIADELQRIQAGLSNEYQTAQANVAGLEKHVQDLTQATSLSNENRIHLDELQRDVDARRAVYDRFLRARDTVREQAVDAPVGRIIAPALPPLAPSSPRTFAVLLLSILGGLTIGLGLALVSDLFLGDRELTSLRKPMPEEPKQAPAPLAAFAPAASTGAVSPAPTAESKPEPEPASRVPVLGHIPPPFGTSTRLSARHWLLERLRAAWPTADSADREPPHPAFTKATGAIFQELTAAPARDVDGCRIFVTTSVSQFERRTTTALGLAQAAAARGARVLVIDADGSGGVLRDLVAPEAKPALLDLLGTNRLCYRIRSELPGQLDIVPVLPDEARIAMRLEAKADTVLIEGIPGNFDLVIFDGPTIGRMSRLNAISASAEAVILVAPPDATAAELDRAISLLDLSSSCAVVAVTAADLSEPGRASVAA